MFGTVLCVATAVLGIDVGWQPNAEGDAQYIIQLEPEMAKRLLEGRPIEFQLRPEHQGVRHFRFQVGKAPVPRAPITAPKPSDRPSDEPGSAAPVAPPEKLLVTPAPNDPATQDSPPVELPGLGAAEQTFGPSDTTSNSAPRIARHEPNVRPLGEQNAVFTEPVLAQKPALSVEPQSADDNPLLVPLIVASGTAVGLFAAFVYLCWIHLGTRRTYRALVAEYHSSVGNLPGYEPTTTPDLLSLRG